MIKKGLKVIVLAGRDKKKEGEVIEIDRKNNRAKVKEINMVKKHVKTTKEKKGGIVSKESFVHISNLKIINEKKKTTKMAKLSSINKNNKRIKLSDKLYKKRTELKKIVMNKKISLEERFKAQQKLSKLPRNSAKIRVMNRCQITGRPHGVYRKLKISRIALRQLGLQGKIPGLVKSSW